MSTGPVFRKHYTVTASSTQTVVFNRILSNAALYLLSGTGAGAIKVQIRGPGGRGYVAIDPNRYDLAAGQPAQKLTDIAMEGLLLTSSGTAATAVILVSAWENQG